MNQADVNSLKNAAPVKNNRGRVAGTVHISWSPFEWETFATMLDTRNPSLSLLTSPDLAGISIRMLCDVGASVTRPRSFAALGAPRIRLLEAFSRLRTAKFKRAPAPASPLSALDGAIAGSHPRTLKSLAIVDTADSIAIGISIADWTRDEWLIVVTELHRAFPVANYPQRARDIGAHLVGIDAEDVAFAQRVLPFARQVRHLRAVSFSTLRTRLVSAFCDLRNRLSSAAAIAPAMVVEAPAVLMAAPIVASLPMPIPAAISEWDAAVAPLAALLARSMVDALRPMLAQLLREVLPPVSAPPSTPAVIAKAVPEAIKIRRPSIGVFGNRSADKFELDSAFPGIEFHCIVSNKQLNSIKNCDKVVVMTSWVGHAAVSKVKSAVGDRFVSVEGPLGALKRQIMLWISSGAIA